MLALPLHHRRGIQGRRHSIQHAVHEAKPSGALLGVLPIGHPRECGPYSPDQSDFDRRISTPAELSASCGDLQTIQDEGSRPGTKRDIG
jgi:hypothetical protein